MMSYDAMISTYENDIRDKDAEIARLRAERDAARADAEMWRNLSRVHNNEREGVMAQLVEAQEALERVINLADQFNFCYQRRTGEFSHLKETPAIVNARATLSRLSSPGAQQRAGEDGK